MSHEEAESKGDGMIAPKQASAFRKGGFILLKEKPCKIVDMTTSKTGKHGHAKVKFTGIDIFTQKKYQEVIASTHNMSEVIVVKTDYAVQDIEPSGQVQCLDSENNSYEFELKDVADEDSLDFKMKQAFEGLSEGQELVVSVTKAMGTEQVMSYKTQAESS